MNGPHPVSFVIHTDCLSELTLQPSDLLLELVSLVFTLHSLLLHAQQQITWKIVSTTLRSNISVTCDTLNNTRKKVKWECKIIIAIAVFKQQYIKQKN